MFLRTMNDKFKDCMFIVHIAVLSLYWLYSIKLCRTTLVGFGKFKIDITTKWCTITTLVELSIKKIN